MDSPVKEDGGCPLRALIVVAGHAVYLGGDPERDEAWALSPFQRGEGAFYREHLRAGVELCARDPAALLVLSGGQTRAEAGPRSEARGYFELAEREGWFGRPEVRGRTALEEHARDSYENLKLSLDVFVTVAGSPPDDVAVVSWRFKARRFALHRDALGWPAERYRFVGPNDPPELAAALLGEERALALFARDPHGLGPELSAKRASRDPFGRDGGREHRGDVISTSLLRGPAAATSAGSSSTRLPG